MAPELIWGGEAADNGVLKTEVTAMAYANYKRLVSRVVEVFGDEIAASTWLSTASPDFGDKPPLQVAQEQGYDPEVLEPVLVRIEHGVYF